MQPTIRPSELLAAMVWCFYELRNGSNDDCPEVYFVLKQKRRLPGEITNER
jgi:hypothetical protein